MRLYLNQSIKGLSLENEVEMGELIFRYFIFKKTIKQLKFTDMG